MGGRSCPAHFGCGSPGLLPRRRPPGGKERGRMGPPPGPGMGSGRDVGLALAIQRPQGGGCAKNPWAETSCRMPGDPHRVAFWPRGSGGRAICWLPLRRFQDQRVNAARSPARLLWRWRFTKPPPGHDGDQPSQFRSKSPERPLDRDVWQEASGAGFDNSRRRALRSILVSTARFR
jgi:hypothetical protein